MASRARSPLEAEAEPLRLFLLGLAILVSAGLIGWATRNPALAALFAAALVGVGGLLFFVARRPAVRESGEAEVLGEASDAALLSSLIDFAAPDALVAVTDLEGRLLHANRNWISRFGAFTGRLPDDLRALAPAARRDRSTLIDLTIAPLGAVSAAVALAGARLAWRLEPKADLREREAAVFVEGDLGRRGGEAGLMLVLTDSAGRIKAANPAFRDRAAIAGSAVRGDLVDHLASDAPGSFRLAAEGAEGEMLRIFRIAADDSDEPSSIFVLTHAEGASPQDQDHFHALLDSLPLGLALVDADGRFLFINRAFARASSLNRAELPTWPGDIVVDEDKAAVSDAVHRLARDPSHGGDLAIRLKVAPDEPVSLTIAGARGLAGASVLLSLKDNTEEVRLKREIAQATKMQAVGQLAGGVAHDFNNILTAILGTCDLMLMRHAPGDSDHDDIQQIRSNTNRAASLTRQLLAFSRQQTLRPQLLQIPDVVAEVSHLLKRLLGERIKLEVRHGRNLGPVRADPGQLEQVIVNLAVNARDAMIAGPGRDPGVLTLQTFAVPSAEVAGLEREILPAVDYTALKVSDTGIGIAPAIIGKIFEPFFTTKEVGKGTGLGLSTVYGIVKQSGGFIFADSLPGEGTHFTLYFPVATADATELAKKPRPREKPGELWGSGTILVVEDEDMVRTVAERALTRHGYTVLTAEDGESALALLAGNAKIDLLVSDVVMPGMDGPTTVREARNLYPELPVLFISGYAEEQLRRSIDLENVTFLAKPFSVQQLAETVRDTLAAKG